MTRHTCHKSNAFTMIELMLVISILMAVGLIAAVGISNIIDEANRRETESTMHQLAAALDAFKADMGRFPNDSDPSLVLALTEPDPDVGAGWKGAGFHKLFPNLREVRDELDNLLITDAWGEDFLYCSSENYTDENGDGRGVERSPGSGTFYNPKTYQLYSKGPNMDTWPTAADDTVNGHDRLGGTEQDDIRNWHHETFYTRSDYP